MRNGETSGADRLAGRIGVADVGRTCVVIDVPKLDRQIAFLQAEMRRLRGMSAGWALDKAARYEEIVETLTQMRKQKQMTGFLGRPIF